MSKLLLTCTVLISLAAAAQAEIVTYTIDSSQSALTVTGNLTGNVASPQLAGSTTTSYNGTIKADRLPGSIQFTTGSALDAILQPNKQQPFTDGTPGSWFADYGRTAAGPIDGTTTVEALRNFVLDVESNPITISGSSFASADLILDIKSGESDWSFGLAFDTQDLSNKGTANGNTTASMVTVAGNVETLTLHFATGPIAYQIFQTADSTMSFSGTIVATRTIIPEPRALVLLCAAGVFSLRRRLPAC
jgi:hypothetical protein